MSKLVTRRVRRGKHVKRGKRSRCGGKHSKRKGYSKYKKHYTRKYGKRIQRRRQTRKKVGGFKLFSLRPKKLLSLSDPFNFVLPTNITGTGNINILGQGWAYVTKLNSRTSISDRPEQVIIYKELNKQGIRIGNYFIARCPYTQCDINDRDNMREKNMKPLLQTKEFKEDKPGEYTFITIDRIHYRIKPGGYSLQVFFTDYLNILSLEQQPAAAAADDDEASMSSAKRTERYIKQRKLEEQQQLLEEQQQQQQQALLQYAGPMQANTDEEVKIKPKSSLLGKETLKDANASISITDKTSDREYPENIYTLYIDGEGKIKFLCKQDNDNGFSYDVNDDRNIDGKCYRLYKFTDMKDKSKSIEIYVPVSRKEGSIFHTLQPTLAGDEYFDIDLCD